MEEPLGHFKKQNTHTRQRSIFQNVWQSLIFLKSLIFTPFLTALSMGITRIGPIPVQPCTGPYSSKLPVAKDITPH